MIAFVIASVLATQPLISTGNDLGGWFVRDTEPGGIGPQHELCQLFDHDQYQVVLPLAKRPIALAVHDQTLWFVGASDPPVLYRARLVENQATGDLRTDPRGRAVAVSPLEMDGVIRDIVILQDNPVLIVENEGIQCFDLGGNAVTPNLPGEEIHVSRLGDKWIGAVSNSHALTLHTLDDGLWQMGKSHEIDGKLQDLVVHDGWPLFIVGHENAVDVIGMQQERLVKIASFPQPSGRWSVVEGEALRVIGVERNGTTTAFEIGWPSGNNTDQVELTEQFGSIEPVELTLMIVTTVIFFVLATIILSRKPKNMKKNSR